MIASVFFVFPTILYFALGALAVITALMIYLPIRKEFTLERLIINSFLVSVIVLLPLFIFIVSFLMVPESKSEAKLGAFDLFIATKIYLLPFVLWAVAALYTTEVVRPKNVDRYWVMLGLFSGVVLSIAMSVFGLISFSQQALLQGIVMALVANPVYIPIWYAIRFWRLFKQSKLNKVSYLFTLISQLPFWGYAIYQAKIEYVKLPETSDCFVATASSHGFPFIVGKPISYQHKGNSIKASQQMIHFWAFEKLWQEKTPSSHMKFRCFYNIWGRKLASHINNPLLASVSFIMLKPIEWIARACLLLRQKQLKE